MCCLKENNSTCLVDQISHYLVSSTVSLFIAMTIMVVGKDLREKHDIKFDEPVVDTVQVNLEEQ